VAERLAPEIGASAGRLRDLLVESRRRARIARRRAIPSRRALPTFLIIGAQKGGTTSLHEYLAEHPGVGAAEIKEVHYFTLHSQRPLDWYRAHFPREGRHLHVFESTPYYLFHPCCPARIRAALPDVRLIALLRDPVSRAHSHHQHERALGFESLEFAEALAREPERLAGEEERLLNEPGYRSYAHQHYSYLARGRYDRQLERWLEHFPREQMLILASEELFSDPRTTVHRVQAWLGLDPHTPARLTARGARAYPPLDDGLRAQLKDVFRDSSARAAHLAEVDFPWA